MGKAISPRKVSSLLLGLGYGLQPNSKTREGGDHPDRNARFEHISRRVKDFQRRGQPVISVDTKKKELIKIADDVLASVQIRHNDFHGEWNYSICPDQQMTDNRADDQVILARVLALGDPGVEPTGLTLGSLEDDWSEVAAIGTGTKEPFGYGLVWASTVFRALGERTP